MTKDDLLQSIATTANVLSDHAGRIADVQMSVVARPVDSNDAEQLSKDLQSALANAHGVDGAGVNCSVDENGNNVCVVTH